MDKTEKRICIYSSVLIALLMSSPKMLALRENGLVAHYWHFNLAELSCQILINLAYCYLFFFINLNKGRFSLIRYCSNTFLLMALNAMVLIASCLIGGIIQRHIFGIVQLRGIYWSGYFTRFLLSSVLAGILIKIVLLLRESKQKDSENQQLKTAYLEAEMELLKEQLNPHFLFNSLSSLSGIVREDPIKAQKYINHLSKIFRYALTQGGDQMVTIDSELSMIVSYGLLLNMRFEEAFRLEIDIAQKYRNVKIPHLSLQPLLENAAKHNAVTIADPLVVKIFVADGLLIVTNNLNQILNPESSTGIGLVNLNSRFRILMHQEIIIEKSANTFTVKLPLN